MADAVPEKGVLQPVLVEESGDGSYVLIAGERRWRAAGMAGLPEVPVIVRRFSDQEKREIALIENIQREDLNPIDNGDVYFVPMNMTTLEAAVEGPADPPAPVPAPCRTVQYLPS